jgi:UDP-N-acetyl-D-mannosaminuronic acid transferase (WecB/TagA/CpsF family)
MGALPFSPEASLHVIAMGVQIDGSSVLWLTARYLGSVRRIFEIRESPTNAGRARPTAVCPANTHIIGEARNNVAFARILARFELVLPDGMPIVWGAQPAWGGAEAIGYTGPTSCQTCCGTPGPWRHSFFGDAEEGLADLRRVGWKGGSSTIGRSIGRTFSSPSGTHLR